MSEEIEKEENWRYNHKWSLSPEEPIAGPWEKI